MPDLELPMQIIYQAIGIIAMVISFLSFQFRNNRFFLAFQCISCLLFSIQFAFVQAWVATIMNAICILRCIFYAFIKNKKLNIIGTSIFILLFIASAILSIAKFNIEIFIGVICCLASIVSTIAIASKNNEIIRICQVGFVSPVWIFNAIWYFSIGGIIAEALNLISALIALIINKKRR